jgi:poly(3-hydroxybutyrate) depolymerase
VRARVRLAPSVLTLLLGWSVSCATTVAPCDTLTGPGDQVCGVPGWEERGYLVHLPPSFDARKSTPVLLALHGGAGDKEKMQTLSCATGQLGDASCLDSLADREGVVVVYPDGTSSASARGPADLERRRW